MNQALNIAVLDRLAEQGYLSAEQREAFGASPRDPQASILMPLLSRGAVPEQAFASALSVVQNLELVTAAQFPDSRVIGTSHLAPFLLEQEVLPLEMHGKQLSLAMSDPSNEFTIKVLQAKLGCTIVPKIAIRSELTAALQRLYEPTAKRNDKTAHDIPEDLQNNSPLVQELHRLIQRAIVSGASDIHLEPAADTLRVRFRVSSVLQDVHSFAEKDAAQVIARIKLMAKLDVTERRRAQNGRFNFPAEGRIIDLRVSTLPLHTGESVVLRLLESTLSQSSLSELGFSPAIAQGLEQAISAQQGMILITGPTGSGKTTTLYSLLNQLNRPELKLISIEDPVELQIGGINQIQVDVDHGIGFAQALKSVLRQDPDVIMVGEIRDAETAQLAAQAALTGHLVLSTLHTASAPSAVTRLRNLGLPDYLISATLVAVLAQRLVRKLCACQQSASAEHCQQCNGTGYQGRIAIAELLPLKESVNLTSPGVEAELQARLLNQSSLRDDAQRLLDAGVSDAAEVARVLGVGLSTD